MDQSEVNKIIMDPEVPVGCKCNEIEKEFMILKGSIKKLILDIREQMNSSENPFSNIQMLQMPPPAPVIKEDPIEFEMPKEDEDNVPAEGEVKAKADQQADQEKTMAQDKKTGNAAGCPFAAKVPEPHGHCPLTASIDRHDQGCPLARTARSQERSCQTSTHYCDMSNYGQQQLNPYGYGGQQTRNARNDPRNDPYHNGHAHSGERHFCATCGRPIGPGNDACQGYWPHPYPPYYNGGWQEQAGRGRYPEASRQQAYDPRHNLYDHREYEPLPYGYLYGSGYAADAGEGELHYRQQNVRRRRVARAPPQYYYQDRDDQYYHEQERYESRQPARDDCEPEYYRPAAAPRRAYREPADLPEERYYGPSPDTQREPVSYRPAPKRRTETYAPAPRYDDEEFEMTEPLPEIDVLPNEPEREEEPLRIRKRARIPRVMPEPALPELAEQPNPKPRRSRAVKHRG